MTQPSATKAIRCAIYTRKSSEEGLEQEFNSLHAQREACEAYVLSQRHEGWQLLPTLYDDGGFSGGNMERPALKALMNDIDAGAVDVIVVYKVDRLTRSLADFAKLVEKMDAKHISFVSVTQQFNTTTSMGRLTLNVLLSFAQFEREVTGERIRDKIALSKAKGKWMGGTVPTGYRCEDHRLLICKKDAALIRHIFTRYLALGSINLLKAELDAEGYCTKQRVSKTGREYGGLPFTKGNLATILRNRVYIGEIGHKGTWHPGNHDAIISIEQFNAVQEAVASNRMKQLGSANAKSPCLLASKLFDDRGNYMSPKHSRTRKRHYRYYTSQAIIQGRHHGAGSLPNIPAHEIEQIVASEILAFLKNEERLHPYIAHETVEQQQALLAKAKAVDFTDHTTTQMFYCKVISEVTLSEHDVRVILCEQNLLSLLRDIDTEEASRMPEQPILLHKAIRLGTVNNGSKVVIGGTAPVSNAYLLKAIARAHAWNQQMLNGEVRSMTEIAKREGIESPSYVRTIMNLQWLAPDITEAVLAGGGVNHITFGQLTKAARIYDWTEQRKALKL